MTIEQIKTKLDHIENSGDWNVDKEVISFINAIIDDIPLPTSITPNRRLLHPSSNSIQLEYNLVHKCVELEVFPDEVLIAVAPKICDWSKCKINRIPNSSENMARIVSAMDTYRFDWIIIFNGDYNVQDN